MPTDLRKSRPRFAPTLSGTTLEGVDILAVSAATGTGIPELKARLLDEVASRPERAAAGAFRLAVDRSFSVAGAGTVVTGAVQSGTINVGDTLLALPLRREVRVRALHAQGRAATSAQAGQRCALNLAGIERDAIARGHWIVDPAHAAMTDRFDAEVRLLASEPRPLRTWSPAHVHIGTTSVQSRVVILDGDRLAPGQSGLVQIVANGPLPLRHGDLFVLRDAGAERTIGGGRVVDLRAPQRKRRTPERKALLAALATEDAATALENLLVLSPGLVDLSAFIIDRGLLEADAANIIELVEPELATLAGTQFAARPDTVDALAASVSALLTAYHATHPEQPGMPGDSLRLKLVPRLAKPQYAALVALLVARNVVVVQAGVLRLPSHSSALGAADQKLWERIERLIIEQKFRPPQVREMAESLGQPLTNIRKLCKTMARIGTLVEVATDRFFMRSALAELGVIAGELAAASADKCFTAAEFKDRVGCGRNVGIQLLEHFDRRGLTARRGDARLIAKAPAEVFGATRG